MVFRIPQSHPGATRIRMIVLAAIVIFGGLSVFAKFQRSLIYAVTKGEVPTEVPLVDGTELQGIQVEAGDGMLLHGWHVQHVGPASSEERKMVIIFPGNSGTRVRRVPLMNDFLSCGWDCLLVDYRGYAENGGTPSEKALTADARSVWNFATQKLGYQADQIVICGDSLGGGVATRLVWELCGAETPPAGLILRATFTSLVDAGRYLYPWLPVNLVLIDRFPSIERIPQITCPILVIHGELDQVVPFSMGEKLFSAAPLQSASGVPKQFVALPGVGHNDLQTTGASAVHQAHLEFLGQVAHANPRAEKVSP